MKGYFPRWSDGPTVNLPLFVSVGVLGLSDLFILFGALVAYVLAVVVLVRFRSAAAPTLTHTTHCPHCGVAHDLGYASVPAAWVRSPAADPARRRPAHAGDCAVVGVPDATRYVSGALIRLEDSPDGVLYIDLRPSLAQLRRRGADIAPRRPVLAPRGHDPRRYTDRRIDRSPEPIRDERYRPRTLSRTTVSNSV